MALDDAKMTFMKAAENVKCQASGDDEVCVEEEKVVNNGEVFTV